MLSVHYAYLYFQAMQQSILMDYNRDSSRHRSREEDIYEDLCYVTLRVGHDRDKQDFLPVEKRDYCIKELVETEKNYYDALNMIIKHFMRPLKGILRDEDRNVIFLHIKQLAQIHSTFHSELYKACVNSSQHKISSCFLTWRDRFVIYGEYCANLPKAQELVDELCNKSEFINQAVLRCQMEANEGRFRLRDLLSLPMQRILKYHLLLNELIKNTAETHDDYVGLQKAHEAMVDLGQYINEVKRDSEMLQIIAAIQQSIVDLEMPDNMELKDYGRLLKDGELRMKSHEDNRIKSRYVFIFDKIMLMCKSIRGEQYSYKEGLILTNYQVEDIPGTNTIAKLVNKQWSHGWLLIHRQTKTSFTFYAKTEDLRMKWVEAINKALDNVTPLPCRLESTDHTFAMSTFDKATNCADCDKLLRGTFFQGYQCTVCQIAVHKQCINTVRSCGAPSLPKRPPIPHSPSVLSNASVEEDNLRNSIFDIRLPNGKNGVNKYRALQNFEGIQNLGQLSFTADDVITVNNRQVLTDKEGTWWDGCNQRTSAEGLFPASYVTEIDENHQRMSYEDPNTIFGSLQSNGCANAFSCTNLDDFPWFAGSMERDRAQNTLDRLPSGTFLVRISPKQMGFAISLNYNGEVKHMKIRVKDQYYYLSESRYFKTIVDLVKWYEGNSLAESFNQVNTSLMTAYKKVLTSSVTQPICFAIAMYSFTGSSSNLLSLKKGDKIAVLSKAGEEKGWWKGQIGDRIGYFPLAYVTEVKE